MISKRNVGNYYFDWDLEIIGLNEKLEIVNFVINPQFSIDPDWTRMKTHVLLKF